MNDNPLPADDGTADMASLRAIAAHVTDDDFARDEPPASMWPAIAARAGRPENPVVELHRTRRRVWIGAAAVAVAVLGIAGGLVMTGGGTDDVIAATALSNAGLSPLGAASSGKAEIIRRGTSYLLHLDVSRVPSEPASYVEVWLIDRQVKGMISLGPYRGNGDYVIPAGVDPAKYPIVDVSIEPSDGVPTHSGVSIVRGVTAT
jgi:anti-sigma-K factor RskA